MSNKTSGLTARFPCLVLPKLASPELALTHRDTSRRALFANTGEYSA